MPVPVSHATSPRRLRFGLALVLLFLSAADVVAAEPVLIAQGTVAGGPLSLNTTRLIFSMQLTQWPDGTPVRVFVLPDDHALHRAFTKDLLSLYPRQLRRVWDRQLYSGTGQAPETVADEIEMRHRVATTPGAVGYLSKEMTDDTIQVLRVD